MCKFLLTQITCKKCFPYVIGFPKSNYQNLTTEYWSKQRFSLLEEKVVIQAVRLRTQAVSKKPGFRPKRRALYI